MKEDLYKEEKLYCADRSKLGMETYDAIRSTIQNNHAVGFVAGYYDENLTITCVSEFFLKNLGYTYEEFMDFTGGSLKKAAYGENATFARKERFQKIQGAGEVKMLTKDGVPVNIRVYKKDSVDRDEVLLWVLSAHMDYMQETLTLVNKVIRSGFWSVEFDEKGEPVSVFFSNEFREMLGYHDVLDFPNRLDVWEESLHPSDQEKVKREFCLWRKIQQRKNWRKFSHARH